jgi:hypothetical protein
MRARVSSMSCLQAREGSGTPSKDGPYRTGLRMSPGKASTWEICCRNGHGGARPGIGAQASPGLGWGDFRNGSAVTQTRVSAWAGDEAGRRASWDLAFLQLPGSVFRLAEITGILLGQEPSGAQSLRSPEVNQALA